MKNSSNSYRKMKNKNYSIAQIILKSSLLLIIMVISSCRNGDDQDLPTNKELIVGKWQVTSGEFLLDNSKYVYINENNTIDILSEDELGFKGEWSTNSTITDNQITLTAQGAYIVNYTLVNDELSLQNPDNSTVLLSRASIGPELDDWIKPLTVLAEGLAPWQKDVDIAFDGTHILGWNNDDDEILKVNPNTLAVDETMSTTLNAYAVEIEKSNSGLKQLFQSNAGSSKFTSFLYTTGSKYYESIDLGSWIRGIASIEPSFFWISSHSEQKLYKYKSNGIFSPGQVLQTISLEFQPRGLDYQNGYLYITDGNKLHKCQTSPNFKAIESYTFPNNNSISGIAFDGNNFWLNTKNYDEDKNKLVKIDL
ncbi:hypothetical protein JBL43_03185 [Aureibaculum sp. A20]|uniref:Lipocalin-like domain-containing protein n=1 Tax=Aureibaculum flavum TaxID=2795986 RepID=A0ABS0WMN3_9FLAO|nr:hypothetical protein [Aureibaculum flavum]MBJ2173223.1 hypothetical protein [Aureibaculum flavum]